MKMPPQPCTDPTLRAENAELRARLEVAEETLRAIRAGEVDALVVEGDAGPQLFTLQGVDAEQSRVRGEMLAQVSDAVIAVDTEERVTYLNAAAEQQYRVRAGDVIGCMLTEIFTHRWRNPQDKAAMRTALSECGAWRGELIHRRPDGSELPVESSATTLRDPDGAITGYVAFIRDITEREQAKKVLSARTAELETLLDTLPGFVWISHDAQCRLIVGNRTANQFVGVEAGANVSQSMVVTGEAPYLRQFREDGTQYRVDELPLQRAVATGLPVRDAVLDFHFRDGRRAQVVGDAAPLFDDQGCVRGGLAVFVDITERKQAEAERQQSERNHRALAAASSEVAYRMSADWSTMLPLDGRHLVANSDQPLADWAWLDQNLPRDEHPRVRQAISEAIARKGLFELEHRVRRLDGSIGWTSSRAVPMLDGNEEVVTWFGAASDITERKQAEEERRLLASIVEHSPDFLGIASTHGNPLYGNRAAMELVGMEDLEQVRRTKIIDYFIPEQRQYVDEVVLPAVATDGRWSGELTMQHFVTGATFPVWFDLFRVDDPVTGQPVNFATITRDLTESKRLQKALADRTELLNGVLEGATDVIFVKDLKGRLLLANGAFGAAAGLTPEQLVGKTDDDWFPPDVAAALRQQDQAVIAGESQMQFEDSIPVTGEERTFHTVKAPLRDSSGHVIGILSIGRDITARKRVELELTDAIAVAEKANRAKSDFLSSMSHELRTPLNAILGFAQLMESGAPAPTPAQKRNLEQISKGGWYLLSLINEILDLALIESGNLSVTQEPVSLAEVMLECRAMCEPQARTCAIDMTFASFELADAVRADRTRVKQVMINLLSNAIKYNKAQGAVAVEWTLSPPDTIRISVRDTGEGLAAEKLAQLFQPFNRLGQEAGPQEGTGIGLVMAKRLVELMGGAIGADSVVGVGSVFWFELKRASAPQSALLQAEGPAPAPSKVPPQVSPGTQPRTVLHVEDNRANQELIEQLVARRPDLRLLSAADGNRAIELTRAHRPQVILMDVSLPGLSGIEVMKILRADPSTAHIPIMAISANALPHDIENGIKAGFFSYLTKPLKVTQFMHALDEILEFSQIARARATG